MNILAEALQDIKLAVLSDVGLEVAVEQAAKDYDLNPTLLRRKFIESFKSVDALIAFSEDMARARAKYLENYLNGKEVKNPHHGVTVTAEKSKGQPLWHYVIRENYVINEKGKIIGIVKHDFEIPNHQRSHAGLRR